MRSHTGSRKLINFAGDFHRAGLMKSAMIAIGGHKKLERFAFNDPFSRNIINHDMGEIGLTRQRTEGREFGTGQPDDIMLCRRRDWPHAPASHYRGLSVATHAGRAGSGGRSGVSVM